MPLAIYSHFSAFLGSSILLFEFSTFHHQNIFSVSIHRSIFNYSSNTDIACVHSIILFIIGMILDYSHDTGAIAATLNPLFPKKK
ncbi:hypothetical protein BDF14DRAFT_1229021 [Spinellus fusiger]|nr:hypothetical protein BDF14DRAFT_1229021 [Spinellus fusiger]